MKQRTIYTDKQPDVLYQKINDIRADVFVNEFIEEEIHNEIDNTSPQTVYVYWTNAFSVNPKEVTENDIKANIKRYLEYNTETNLSFEEIQMDFNIDIDYRVSMLELGLI